MISSEAGSFYEDFSKTNYFPFKTQEEEHNQRLITPDTRHLPTPAVDLLVATTASSNNTPPISNGYFNPASVPTIEQEMYAQPFLEALNQRFQQDGSSVSSDGLQCHSPPNATHPSFAATMGNPSLESTAPTYVTATMSDINNVFSSDINTTYSATGSHTASFAGSYLPMATSSHSHIAHESYPSLLPVIAQVTQNGGVMQSQGYSTEQQPSTMSQEMLRQIVPADMKTMEHMKVERKKARNRIAASKCRLRRLQRESDLQEKVRRLKDHNQELNNELNALREKVHNLKKVLTKHMRTGCNVDLPQGFRTDILSSSSE